jgi:serine/threonine protein kinase
MSKPSALTRQLKAQRALLEGGDEEVVIEIKDYQEQKSGKVGLKDFELLSVLGKGAYGKVYLVKKSNVLYAMKVLKKASIVLHTHSHEQTRNERNILQELEFQFIVKLHYAFQTETKLYLLLTYAPGNIHFLIIGGELFGYLAKEKMFPEDSACFYTAEILVTLDHLHELGIIYRDLKPENVLLAADGHICLTDFGLSKVALTASTVCGTPEFTAPEIFEEKDYDKAVDYWSLGVMLYDMLTGSPPFTGHNRKKIMESILRKKPVFPNYLTPQAKDICGKLLKKNPKQRLGTTGVEVAKKHSFFRKIDWKLLLERKVEPPFVPDLVLYFTKLLVASRRYQSFSRNLYKDAVGISTYEIRYRSFST